MLNSYKMTNKNNGDFFMNSDDILEQLNKAATMEKVTAELNKNPYGDSNTEPIIRIKLLCQHAITELEHDFGGRGPRDPRPIDTEVKDNALLKEARENIDQKGLYGILKALTNANAFLSQQGDKVDRKSNLREPELNGAKTAIQKFLQPIRTLYFFSMNLRNSPSTAFLNPTLPQIVDALKIFNQKNIKALNKLAKVINKGIKKEHIFLTP